jgi:NADP-dependent 3-hydroxy acid dehydrogenase YdfG
MKMLLACQLICRMKVVKVMSNLAATWEQVDVVIHNAGAFVKTILQKLAWKNSEKIYEVNVFGVVR